MFEREFVSMTINLAFARCPTSSQVTWRRCGSPVTLRLRPVEADCDRWRGDLDREEVRPAIAP